MECIRVHTKDNFFAYGFVQFKTSDAAKEALTKCSHKIGNCSIKVKEADVWHQPHFNETPQHKVHPLSTPPDFDSDANILNALNDDCLRVIFKQLNLIDLTNTADVCVRFNYMAKEVFATKHKKFVIPDRMFLNRRLGVNIQTIETMLRHFGPSIQTLTVSPFAFVDHDIMFQMITKYTSTTLKHLILIDFEMVGNGKLGIIEKLELIECEIDNLKDLLANAPNLKILHIYSSMWFDGGINQRFDKLEEIRLEGNENLYVNQVNNFIKLNPKLKRMAIKDNADLCSAKIIRVIGQRLHNLEELEINEGNDGTLAALQKRLQTLSQLKSLQLLNLDFHGLSVALLMKNLAANQIPIKELKLMNGEIDDNAIESISQLKHIEILKLDGITRLNDDHIVELAKQLPLLQELDLKNNQITSDTMKKVVAHANQLSTFNLKEDSDLSITTVDYNDMLKSVQNRPKAVKLSIIVFRGIRTVDIDDDILDKNKDWISIIEDCSDSNDTIQILVGYGLLNVEDLFSDDDANSDEDEDMFHRDFSDDSDVAPDVELIIALAKHILNR